MLSIASKSCQPDLIFREKASESFAFTSYLNHRRFYRGECFNLLKAVFYRLHHEQIERLNPKEVKKPKEPPKAKCGHPLWHPWCKGCNPINTGCWGRCVCFDWQDDQY